MTVDLMLTNLKPKTVMYYLHLILLEHQSPNHTHDTDNHGVITRGELLLTMNGEVTKVAKGEWYHVPANVEHSANFDIETDEVEFWVKENT
ncbi:MAG: quercetin dioxygenase-like cupin family protein [Paraglaciecola sp.]|jgi:quercetin dioxygenase-like cupin family protein